jgi:hypothetical protein
LPLPGQPDQVCTLRDGKIVHDEIHTERGQAQQKLN